MPVFTETNVGTIIIFVLCIFLGGSMRYCIFFRKIKKWNKKKQLPEKCFKSAQLPYINPHCKADVRFLIVYMPIKNNIFHQKLKCIKE